MNGFFARLQEPSTHAALAGLAGIGSQLAVAMGADAHTVGIAGGMLSALFALAGVFMPESTAPGAPTQGQ